MHWERLVEELKNGETVQFRPKGNSMVPKIHSGDLVTVGVGERYKKGDIVFCRVGRTYYVHLIKAIKGDRYLIGNNRGGTNGWIRKEHIFGKVIDVGDNTKRPA